MLTRRAASAEVRALLEEDDDVAVWWGTWVECSFAISRLRREGGLDEEGESEAQTSLDTLDEDSEFVCLDDLLRRAASEKGFDVLPGLSENG